MELAAIITTIIVVILQIITIALVVGTRKIVRDQAGKNNSNFSNDRAGDRKDRDFRMQNKRPVQDQKKPSSQQPTNTGSVDTVEKSLRDINLKLKNAERDQEFARRKVQENFSKDPNRRNGNDRNSRGGRDNRDTRDNRDHRHSHDRNTRDRRSGGNWQERNKTREPLNFGATPQNEEALNIENQNSILAPEQTLNHEPIAQVQTPAVVVDNTPDLVPSDFSSDENLQHGRKILVKRRMLKEDENQSSDENNDINSADFSSSNPVSETTNSEESSEVNNESASEGEIKFGRR